ncbi:MAG: hypothetical protein C00003105_02009 [ANME-2 cluster archaeon HR1]|nr:MAG: hypothetical protein C00003105_02009 [ANME-2 cluster archaeon HR1]
MIEFSYFLVPGGFPEIFHIFDLTKAFYVLRDDVMNKAIYHDIVTLFKIKEPQIVESLLLYLAANSAQILNKDELSKDMGCASNCSQFLSSSSRSSLLSPVWWRMSRSVPFVIDSSMAC